MSLPGNKPRNSVKPRRVKFKTMQTGEAVSTFLQLNGTPDGQQLPDEFEERHAKQLNGLKLLTNAAQPIYARMRWSYICVDNTSGKLLAQIDSPDVTATIDNGADAAGHAAESDVLILFNVLVALEWVPTQRYLSQLKWAFKRASDFLYDITNGAMAFGQVIFLGAAYLPYADIVIAASNRYHPATRVNGLYDPDKYMPIRLGRGLWSKNLRRTISWDEPEGYRTIVHEWGHYALGLKDQYLVQQTISADAGLHVVVPTISLPVETIMATLEGTSELTPEERIGGQAVGAPRKEKSDRHAIADNPRFAVIAEMLRTDRDGPNALPLPLPRFLSHDLNALPSEYDALQQDAIPLTSAWPYVLERDSGGAIKRLLAQGVADRPLRSANRMPDEEPPLMPLNLEALTAKNGNPAQSFPIYSSNLDDLFLIGEFGMQSELVCFRRRGDQLEPHPIPAPPFVDVIPQGKNVGDTGVLVQVEGSAGDPPNVASLHPLLSSKTEALRSNGAGGAAIWSMGAQPVDPGMDGHVLLEWNDRRLLAVNYALGGSPAKSGFPGGPNPLPAGSSEGNMLLFFYDEQLEQLPEKPWKYAAQRIVTVRMPGSPGGLPQPDGAYSWEPRSYAFSVASNLSLAGTPRPTLVMFYDRDTAERNEVNDLAIFRYDRSNSDAPRWIQLVITYQPANDPFIAVPLTPDTAPGLFTGITVSGNAEPVYVERFRMFLRVAPEKVRVLRSRYRTAS